MQASRYCVRCASSQEMAEHLRVSTPAHELFELILMQGDAVQQITLILGGSIIVHTEPFADNTELVEHFNGRRGHPFDFNIHSKTPFPKMPKCKGQEPSRGHKLSILENFCPFGTASCWGVGSPKPCRERVRQTGIFKLVFANNL